ncbi:MAG TPA: hypothetical protein VFN96_00075, partial [Gemmatimonadales bacterium]|nr:hypothetical protein [Gemmatimonadales bacterium]
LLVEEGRRARFFLVGEEHGVAELPGLVKALLAELRPAGYNTLALEVSPLQAGRLEAMSRRPGVRAALDTLLGSWLTAVPFYSLAPERDLLASAMSREGALPPMRIWGLDYDVSGDRLFLRELERLAPPSGRAAVRRARELADSGFALLARQGNPSRLFAWTAPDSVFEALRAAFGRSPPPRARAIIDLFERTARINRHFLSGRVYESNLDRAAFLRQNFAAALARAEAGGRRPRVLFKFGGSHMMRGWNYTHTLDIGTAAAITAEARGERSFHLLVLGGPGSKSSRMNIVKGQYEPTGRAEIEGTELDWLRPALTGGDWQLFDLRPVRARYLQRRSVGLTPIQDRFLLAYDAIVVLTGSTPSPVVPVEVREE